MWMPAASSSGLSSLKHWRAAFMMPRARSCAMRQQLLRRVAVGRRLGDAGLDLLPQAGDAHHEELAEDRADDADELDALEQRVVGVAGLVQHALEEVEHAELAVDVERRVAQVGVGQLGLRLQLSGELLLRGPGRLLDGLAAVVLVGARPVLWPLTAYLLTSGRSCTPRRRFGSGRRPDLTVYAQIVARRSPACSVRRTNGGGRRVTLMVTRRPPPYIARLRSPCSRPARRRAPRS